jgi:catechol-2,3-dioxygenase
MEFYRDVLGLELKSRGLYGAFLGRRPDASHELALFPLDADAPGPEQTRVGLYHLAWEMDSFADLEKVHERLVNSGSKIVGYSPRQFNVMFHDPDGNELECIWEPSDEEMERIKAAGPLPRLPEVAL